MNCQIVKDIEFTGKGWSPFERSVRLKVKGQEVVVVYYKKPEIRSSEVRQ